MNNQDLNIFMMCDSLNQSALSEMPEGFCVRNLRKDELDLWKRMPFDDEETANRYMGFMTDYYNRVYAPMGSLFFKACLFVVDAKDRPIGTCFTWKAYGKFTTVHWYKVLKSYEGRGIGRALLSQVMSQLAPEDYPVYLHTQSGSFRAIKLYSDFGFKILTDKVIGQRENQIDEVLPLLKEWMPHADYGNLKFAEAHSDFLTAVSEYETTDF